MTDARSHGDGEDVGSLGVEAARLLGALQEWAAHNGGGYAGAAASFAAGAAGLAHDVDAHLATGSRECTYCPVCRLVSALRGTSPEVRTQLRTAATSLLRAAAGMLATDVPAASAAAGDPAGDPAHDPADGPAHDPGTRGRSQAGQGGAAGATRDTVGTTEVEDEREDG
jgi:hypothetical protein